MKVKLYIEKILKIGVGVCGFTLISSVAFAQDSHGGIQDTRQWNGFEIARGGFHDAIDAVQRERNRVQDGVKMHRDDYLKARKAYEWALKYDPDRVVSSGYQEWLEGAKARYEALKEHAELIRDISQLQMRQAIEKLTSAAQTLKYANHEFPRRSDQRTEDSLFEALGEGRGLEPNADGEKGARSVEAKALHFKLSEALGKSSEVASEHAASGFIMDKLNVFENGRTFEFAKEDYFDDFKEKYGKGEDKVAKDILRDNKESKIERIALAAERGEGRRAEKAEAKDEKAEVKEDKKVEKAEVKEEKKAEKEERKAEKKAEKDDSVKDKKDDVKSDSDGGKKDKGK